MRKTSVYLSDAERERLARLAVRERTSQAEIIRKAIAGYVPDSRGDREFRMAGVADRTGRSVADVPEEELLDGFGADAFSE